MKKIKKKKKKENKRLGHWRHDSKPKSHSWPHEKPCCCVVVSEKKEGVPPSRTPAGKSPKPSLESWRDQNEWWLCAQGLGRIYEPPSAMNAGPELKQCWRTGRL